jgi:hypothetical protein
MKLWSGQVVFLLAQPGGGGCERLDAAGLCLVPFVTNMLNRRLRKLH